MTVYPSGVTKIIKILWGTNTPWWELTRVHIDDTVRVAGSHETILQQEALVVMGSIVDEGLMVAFYPSNTCDFITSRHIVETCFNLKKWKKKPFRKQTVIYISFTIRVTAVYLHIRPVIEQVQEGSQSVNILSTQEAVCWLWHEDRARVDAAPSPPGWDTSSVISGTTSSAHFNEGMVSFQLRSMMCLCLNVCWCWPQCFVGQHLLHWLTHDRLQGSKSQSEIFD